MSAPRLYGDINSYHAFIPNWPYEDDICVYNHDYIVCWAADTVSAEEIVDALILARFHKMIGID